MVNKYTALKKIKKKPTDSLSTKRNGKELRFGTLNIGTLNKVGIKEEIIDMMIRKKISVISLT